MRGAVLSIAVVSIATVCVAMRTMCMPMPVAPGATASVEAMAEAGRLQRGVHQSHEDELQVMTRLTLKLTCHGCTCHGCTYYGWQEKRAMAVALPLPRPSDPPSAQAVP